LELGSRFETRQLFTLPTIQCQRVGW